jgi:excisionase family DNA binding protein
MVAELEKTNRVRLTPLRQAAGELGISASTLRRDIRDGRISVVRYGRKILVPEAEMRRLAEHGLQTKEISA